MKYENEISYKQGHKKYSDFLSAVHPSGSIICYLIRKQSAIQIN